MDMDNAGKKRKEKGGAEKARGEKAKPLNVANELKCSAALKHSLNMIGPSVMMMRNREMSWFLRQIQGK